MVEQTVAVLVLGHEKKVIDLDHVEESEDHVDHEESESLKQQYGQCRVCHVSILDADKRYVPFEAFFHATDPEIPAKPHARPQRSAGLAWHALHVVLWEGQWDLPRGSQVVDTPGGVGIPGPSSGVYVLLLPLKGDQKRIVRAAEEHPWDPQHSAAYCHPSSDLAQFVFQGLVVAHTA